VHLRVGLFASLAQCFLAFHVANEFPQFENPKNSTVPVAV
jgi:hypothetical protein